MNLLVACTFLLLSSCSPEAKHETLSVFFDGVPDTDSENESADDSTHSVTEKKTDLKKRVAGRMPQNVYHPPYQDKLCDECHDSNRGFKLIESEPDLCFSCHDDFRENIKVLHGPVALGACTECHHPHLAKNKKLLKRKDQKLCTYCHNLQVVLKNDVHKELDDTLCVECHSAHGGDDEYFLN